MRLYTYFDDQPEAFSDLAGRPGKMSSRALPLTTVSVFLLTPGRRTAEDGDWIDTIHPTDAELDDHIRELVSDYLAGQLHRLPEFDVPTSPHPARWKDGHGRHCGGMVIFCANPRTLLQAVGEHVMTQSRD